MYESSLQSGLEAPLSVVLYFSPDAFLEYLQPQVTQGWDFSPFCVQGPKQRPSPETNSKLMAKLGNKPLD